MPRIFDRRPLGWLLLAVFSALYSCRAAVGAVIAVIHGDNVVVFWRVVELVFFAWLAVASMRRTSAPIIDPAP